MNEIPLESQMSNYLDSWKPESAQEKADLPDPPEEEELPQAAAPTPQQPVPGYGSEFESRYGGETFKLPIANYEGYTHMPSQCTTEEVTEQHLGPWALKQVSESYSRGRLAERIEAVLPHVEHFLGEQTYDTLQDFARRARESRYDTPAMDNLVAEIRGYIGSISIVDDIGVDDRKKSKW